MSAASPAYLSAPSQTPSVVVGGGTMGADVAVVLARAQSPVTVIETNAARHDAIVEKVRGALADIGQAELIQHLSVAASLDEVDWTRVRLVIECIPESLPAKQGLFADLVKRSTPDTVLASNSSSFPISQIGDGLATQGRMVGLHFFMPAHLVPLVEVVRGENTDPAAADALKTFMRRCGSVPVLVKRDIPGFLANRLQHALAREAFSLLEQDIASAEDIDAAVRFGFGFRFLAAGPVMQRDHAGLEVHTAAAATMYPSLSNTDKPAAVLSERVKAGQYGMKSGQGFYTWNAETAAAERARYDRMLREGLALIAADLPRVEP